MLRFKDRPVQAAISERGLQTPARQARGQTGCEPVSLRLPCLNDGAPRVSGLGTE